MVKLSQLAVDDVYPGERLVGLCDELDANAVPRKAVGHHVVDGIFEESLVILVVHCTAHVACHLLGSLVELGGVMGNNKWAREQTGGFVGSVQHGETGWHTRAREGLRGAQAWHNSSRSRTHHLAVLNVGIHRVIEDNLNLCVGHACKPLDELMEGIVVEDERNRVVARSRCGIVDGLIRVCRPGVDRVWAKELSVQERRRHHVCATARVALQVLGLPRAICCIHEAETNVPEACVKEHLHGAEVLEEKTGPEGSHHQGAMRLGREEPRRFLRKHLARAHAAHWVLEAPKLAAITIALAQCMHRVVKEPITEEGPRPAAHVHELLLVLGVESLQGRVLGHG
mmetsp:Transcript_24288/g.65850  ORF Transcript_24288/g.65850 Transcript_24288/m.65850 type:complete len:341 (-) Transcript_24288:302-1324(-)